MNSPPNHVFLHTLQLHQELASSLATSALSAIISHIETLAIFNINSDISDNAAQIAGNANAISNNSDSISSIAADLTENTKCSATNWSYGCCSSDDPCTLNQGDCNSDEECYGDLKCGTDNCVGYNDIGTYILL